MSELDAKTYVNYLPAENVQYSTLGYGSIGFSLAGTFAGGTIKIQGSNDGNTWSTLAIPLASSVITNNEIVATGNYVVSCVSFQLVRILLTGFSGNIILRASLSTDVLTSGTSGTFPNLPEGVLWNPGAGGAIQAIPNGNTGQLLTSRGAGLIPEMRNAADISAFTTGSALVSNPVQANTLADFARVTALSGVLAYVNSSGAGTTNLRGIAYGAGLYVVVGVTGIIMTSPTGLTGTWTARTSGTANDFRGINYSGSKFVAVGNSGTIATSSDGITWAVHNVGTTDNLYAATGSGTRWIVTGANARTWWSTTATASSWTQVTFSGVAANTGVGAFYSSSLSLFFVGGDNTGSYSLYSSTDGTAWTSRQTVASTGGFWSFAANGINLVAVGTSGTIYTSTNGTAWTSRTSGTGSDLRVMYANGYFYCVGSAGVSIVSTDNGATWGAGPAVGTTNFIRAVAVGGTNSVVVGDTGTILSAGFPFRSTVYPTNADRLANTNALGFADYVYSDSPIPVIIAGQLTFNIAVVLPADMPFNFDVVTIADMVYNLFVVQNSSLSPGPYYCFNAVYDFGVDNRWEFGAQSVAQYATLLIQDSTTGSFYIKKSSTSGNAGQPITWVDSFMIDAAGGLTLSSLAGVGSRTVVASAAGKLSAP